jgi:hypothetical protein
VTPVRTCLIHSFTDPFLPTHLHVVRPWDRLYSPVSPPLRRTSPAPLPVATLPRGKDSTYTARRCRPRPNSRLLSRPRSICLPWPQSRSVLPTIFAPAQWLYIYVDRDVANVAMVVHLCCKYLLPIFYLFFICMLQVCLSGCYICSTHTRLPSNVRRVHSHPSLKPGAHIFLLKECEWGENSSLKNVLFGCCIHVAMVFKSFIYFFSSVSDVCFIYL